VSDTPYAHDPAHATIPGLTLLARRLSGRYTRLVSETQKKVAAGVIIGVAAVVAVYMWWSNREPRDSAWQYRQLMDSETGELVKIQLTADLKPFPHVNPKTGKATLYPFETCYWGACEQAGGTRIILEEQQGRPGPTLCRKCGHRVALHNPGPRHNTTIPNEHRTSEDRL